MKLSILIPTVPRRFNTFLPNILNQLAPQINKNPEIELLVLLDNKRRTTGEKRTALMSIAKGEFLVFIDDDDRIADTYIADIMDALQREPDTDCVVFDCICTIAQQNNRKVYCKYGIEFEYTDDLNNWRGKPAHTMVWRSSIAKACAFPEKNRGEDIEWVKKACINIKKQTRIDKVLYYYDCDNSRSEWIIKD